VHYVLYGEGMSEACTTHMELAVTRGEYVAAECRHCNDRTGQHVVSSTLSGTALHCGRCGNLSLRPPCVACITCGEPTTETVRGQIGDSTGVMCADCQH